MKQHTLSREIKLQGKGIHLGVPVSIALKPAAENYGIRFLRTDTGNREPVRARVDYVGRSVLAGRQTTLGEGAQQIATVEHLMAAFHGLGVDNALVEINGSELPALDGSAKTYVDAIREAGLSAQKADRHYITVTKPISFEDGKGSYLTLLPAEDFRVSYTLSYGGVDIQDQFASFQITPETFLNEIAPARTFCLRKEAEYLKSKGYGQGADLANTVVYDNGKPLETQLRFADEAARHKVLDLIGDLYLAGHPIKAHVMAVRTGHAQNLELVKRLLSSWSPEEFSGNGHDANVPAPMQLGLAEIKKIIPHRYPFLWVDRIVELEPGKRAVGIKHVTSHDYFFEGHFPGHPIMPGVIIIEAMAQVGAVAMLCIPENRQKIAYFMSIDEAKFRKPVLPGSELRMEIEILKTKSRIGQCRGTATVNGEVVCEAEVKFAFVKDTTTEGAPLA